jgi:CrcB protein
MLTVLAICLGASAGALARWQLSLWLNQGTALLPWGTLAANWVGAYAVGMAVVYFQSQAQLDPAWRLAVITGFLGALTTFSTFSVEVVALLQHGRWLLATGNATLHLLGSLLLTVAGMKTASLWWSPG